MCKKGKMKRTGKLLIFSEYYYPAENTTAYYLTRIARVAAENFAGPVHLFCAVAAQSKEDSAVSNLVVHRLDDGRGNKNKIWCRLLKFTRISARFTWAALRYARSGDTVFAVTNPAFMVLVLAFLKKIFKYRYILLAYDIFPENLAAAGMAGAETVGYRISKKVFDWGYRQADRVISIGRDMSGVLVGKGVAPEKIELLTNWADSQQIQALPMQDNRIIRQYQLEDKCVFCFAGNFGRVQGIPELLQIIEKVTAPQAAFLFIGDGAMRSEIEEMQKKYPDKNIFLHHYLPLSEQNLLLNACKVAIVTLGKNMKGLGVPSKSYYAMASAHPIFYIGEADSEVAFMVQEAQCGWQIKPGEITAAAAMIDLVCTLPRRELDDMGQRGRAFLQEFYSESVCLKKYADFFQKTREMI